MDDISFGGVMRLGEPLEEDVPSARGGRGITPGFGFHIMCFRLCIAAAIEAVRYCIVVIGVLFIIKCSCCLFYFMCTWNTYNVFDESLL
jgi:hypothetical protein